jgi:anti-anti-sigma regulatory factor/anti-sigma regulatory factor (Ser/Thr protein kinase)
MPRQLTCRPERDFPVAVLKVVGSLDILTAPTVRRAVHRCLADQPAAVLVDVEGMEVGEPLALAVFAALTRQAAEWPNVPIVLCAPGATTADRLAHSPVRRSVQVTPTCAEALARTGTNTAPQRIRRRLRPVLDACRQAREVVVDACARWELTELAGSACVITSELVANVVRHARTPMELTLAMRSRRLSVSVRDGSTREPRPNVSGPTTPGGRGLLLVRELADRWGTLPVADGKVVWATLTA